MYTNAYRGNAAASTQAQESALGLLKMLNKQELEQLNDDDAKLMDLINDLPQVKALSVEKENVMMSNKSAAEYNLSRQPRLEQARSELARVYEEAVEQQKLYENAKTRLGSVSSAESLDTVLALLQTECAKAEEDSEEIMERFMSGQLEIDQFLQDYTTTRTLSHLRKVKVEKLQEIIQNQNRQGAAPSSAAVPPPAIYNYPQPASHNTNRQSYGAAPYPMYGGMPDASAYLPR